MTADFSFDLIVIGSGPAGEKAALHAALHGRKVAVVEKRFRLGGTGVNTGTIPSKTLRETAIYLSGLSGNGLYGVRKKLDHAPDARELLFRERTVVRREGAQVGRELLEDRVAVFFGTASFLDPHTIAVEMEDGRKLLTGAFILVATGSRPAHPDGVPFDGVAVFDSDTILTINRIPASICIVGAGVIGCEYACIFAALGSRVILVNRDPAILSFLDGEVSAALVAELKLGGVEPRFGVRFDSVSVEGSGPRPIVRAMVSDGNPVEAEVFLYATGRVGNTAELNAGAVGLRPTPRGALEVDKTYRTTVPHVYAAGDVIGFPALGSISMDQGRVAVTHMFGLHDVERIASAVPYGIYTIPEVAMVGLTEEEAHKQGLPHAVARANYADVPRGVIIGAERGFLKIVHEPSAQTVLGVHIIGPQAAELIHYGMELVENRESLAHVTGTVFNFPTLHELYKYAAYSAWEKTAASPAPTGTGTTGARSTAG